MTIQAIQAAPPGHYRAKNVAKSEVVKMLTLRSTAVMLGRRTSSRSAIEDGRAMPSASSPSFAIYVAGQ